MSTHLVDYRDTDNSGNAIGPNLKLDLSDGRIYDAHGNQVDKMTPADDEKTQILADYISTEADAVACYSMAQNGPEQRERAKHMAYLMSARNEGSAPVLMDLGQADVHIPAAMPNFASGYRNEPPIADQMAPCILAPKQVDNFFQYTKEDAYQRALPLAGAPGGEVGEISPRLGNAQYSAKERALGGWVSTQIEANADVPLRVLQATSKRVMNALIIEREIRVATLLQTTGSWNSAQVITVTAGAKWNGGASSDPVKNLHNAIEASFGGVTAIGLSELAFHEFQRNSQVQKFIQYKAGAAPLPNATQMASILELPPFVIGRMKYITGADSVAPTYVWGNDVVLIRQPEEMPPTSQDDVATAYTFRWNVSNPKDGASTNGWVVRQFFTQNRGSMGGMKIVVVHHDAEVMTSKFAGGLIHNAIQ